MGLKFNTGNPTRDRILGQISDMKYPDLKYNCVIRGIDFDLMLSMDFPKLSTWLERNWDNKQNQSRLKEFDDHMDSKLQERGYKESHPLRRFRQMTGNHSEEELPGTEKPIKPPKVEKVVKPKREKDSSLNIFKGTKKEYIYHLAKKLFDKFSYKYDNKGLVQKFSSQMVDKANKKFNGGINEKSVKIWMKRSLDLYRK